MTSSSPKMWGEQEFWGVGYDYDPQWVLTPEQQELQAKLIELCRTTLRPNAVVSDRSYIFPRENVDALASLNLHVLLIPKELGGLGESYTAACMVCETISRYGCPSTALVYVMHLCALAVILYRHHDSEHHKEFLKRIKRERLLGTLCFSDPATGSHHWYPLSSKTKKTGDGKVRLLKYSSWTTSAGFADFYITQAASEDSNGDYSNTTSYLVWKDEVRADTSDWSGLGMHGNQSGPVVIDTTVEEERRIGEIGDGGKINVDIATPWFLLTTSAVWNGLAFAAIDLAKKHVTGKFHGDVGHHVSDYPTIRDYFGEHISHTNSLRCFVFEVAAIFDRCTNNCDWSIYANHSEAPSSHLNIWTQQTKLTTAKNCSHVVDKMLHSCGGSGYKSSLGLERILRDAKASWLMNPTNEVLRQLVGVTALLGSEALDLWSRKPNHRKMHEEVKKMTIVEKKKLADRLVREVAQSEMPKPANDVSEFQDQDFDNPLSTGGPTLPLAEKASLQSDVDWVKCKVVCKRVITSTITTRMEEIRIALPDKSKCLGILPGQYIEVGVTATSNNPTFNTQKTISRFFSPTSNPEVAGFVDICVKYESHGQFSNVLKELNPGSEILIRGPCGGLEYHPNKLDNIILLVAGAGATPVVQMIRASFGGKKNDSTNFSVIYFAENPEDFLYKDELDKCVKSSKGKLKIGYTINEQVRGWTGDVGYIDMKKMKKYLPEEQSLGNFKVIVCGGAQMVTTSIELLFLMGFPSESIFIYGPFASEQMRRVYGRNAALTTHKL